MTGRPADVFSCRMSVLDSDLTSPTNRPIVFPREIPAFYTAPTLSSMFITLMCLPGTSIAMATVEVYECPLLAYVEIGERAMGMGNNPSLTVLAIAVSNPHPEREEHGLGTWLLLKGEVTFEIQLAHNRDNKPYVVDKRLLQENPGG